jgi:hypothetical protein
MGGLGIAEIMMILLIVALPAFFFLGLPSLRRGRTGGDDTTLERRLRGELEVLHLRLDMLTKRLDDAGIPGPSDKPKLTAESDKSKS